MRHIIELFKTYLLIVGIAKEEVKEVYMGQVVQAACKQSPARQAALFAGNNNFPVSNIRVSNCTLIYNVCPEAALT